MELMIIDPKLIPRSPMSYLRGAASAGFPSLGSVGRPIVLDLNSPTIACREWRPVWKPSELHDREGA